MPKPIFGDNGSGMHVHQSLFNEETNLFFEPSGYGMLSDTARWYVGGLLAHAPALLALCAPTTNSYRRLVPGYEAPINLVYSQRNRSACVRIPTYSDSPRARRIEFRPPDPSANPYLAFSAMLMAGLDGIQNRIQPPAPIDADLYELDDAARAGVKSTPGSLAEVLDALERDHEFLVRGEVFSESLIRTWIDYKREKELDPVQMRPHPYEFFLYHDV
jgi:glutamine synthetase